MKTTAIHCCILLFLLFLLCVSVSNSKAQPANWQSRGVGGGGALFYPSINPANDNEFYVADMKGVYFLRVKGKEHKQIMRVMVVYNSEIPANPFPFY